MRHEFLDDYDYDYDYDYDDASDNGTVFDQRGTGQPNCVKIHAKAIKL